MTHLTSTGSSAVLTAGSAPASQDRAAKASPFGCPRKFFGCRFVYTVISPRARGLSIGVNMNPDRLCNFDCVYCEVDRTLPQTETKLDVAVMAEELDQMLATVRSGKIRDFPGYRGLSDELLRLRHVALSGDGEPTICPNFAEAVQVVVQARARRPQAFFKLAFITNGSGLDLRHVPDSFQYFTPDDEIWIKLDAGTQSHMARINRAEVPLDKILANILLVGRQRPVIIQSLFPMVGGEEPAPGEIDEYILRLHDLKQAGAHVTLVQIYSATRPVAHPDCGHMPLRKLSGIARRIKTETGLKAEVF